MIKSIFVDQLGEMRIGNPNMYSTYDKIEYEINTEMYRCYRNNKLEVEYNKRFVIKIEYE
jgi:hypothetical protein